MRNGVVWCWEAEGKVAVMIVVRLARLVLSAGMSWVWADSTATGC